MIISEEDVLMNNDLDMPYEPLGQEHQSKINYDYELYQSVYVVPNGPSGIVPPYAAIASYMSSPPGISPFVFPSYLGNTTVHFFFYAGYAFRHKPGSFEVNIRIVHINNSVTTTIAETTITGTGSTSTSGVRGPIFLACGHEVDPTQQGYYTVQWCAAPGVTTQDWVQLYPETTICFLARQVNMYNQLNRPILLYHANSQLKAPLPIPTTAAPLQNLSISCRPIPNGGHGEYFFSGGPFDTKTANPNGTVSCNIGISKTLKPAGYLPNAQSIIFGEGEAISKIPTFRTLMPEWIWEPSTPASAHVPSGNTQSFLATIQDYSATVPPKDQVLFQSTYVSNGTETVPVNWDYVAGLSTLEIKSNTGGVCHFRLIGGTLDFSTTELRIILADSSGYKKMVAYAVCNMNGPLLLVGSAHIPKTPANGKPPQLIAQWKAPGGAGNLFKSEQLCFSALLRD